MKKILVTGGAGFIGSHVTTALLELGYEIRILDSLSTQIHDQLPTNLSWLLGDAVEFMRGSVTSYKDMSKAICGVDAIIHLAAETGTAQSMYEIARYNKVNTQGMAILLDVLANSPKNQVQRIMLASSRSVYGEGAYLCATCASPQKLYPESRSAEQLEKHCWEPLCATCSNPLQAVATSEDDLTKPASIYAATKLAQEELLKISCTSLGIGYAILRLQNVYGEGQSLSNPYTGILSIFSTRVRRDLYIPIFEDGKETRDFIHVEDVANAIVASLQAKKALNQIFNVGTGIGVSVIEIASTLSEALGKNPNLVVTNQYRLGDIRHNRADIYRLNHELNFSPKIQLIEGLQRFVNWVEQQKLPLDQLDVANAQLIERRLLG
jgi:dTDP-L-rhamnose 4-epimerase